MACMIDFRCLDEGLGGPKNKRKRSPSPSPPSTSMDIDSSSSLPASKRPALPSQSDPNRPAPFGRPTYDGVIAGKVSGRKWKQPRTRRASAANSSRVGTTAEQREREKQIKKAFRERVGELKEEIRKNKAEKRTKREEREKKKKENVLRTGTKFQKISNPKTLKKIAKTKKKKLLKVVPDEIFGKKKNAS